MQLTRNHITFLGNFGKIDPWIHFDVFSDDFEICQNRPWGYFSQIAPKVV